MSNVPSQYNKLDLTRVIAAMQPRAKTNQSDAVGDTMSINTNAEHDGVPSWASNISNTNLKKLESLQSKTLRQITEYDWYINKIITMLFAFLRLSPNYK